jgi:RNA polymerase sigma-70 factor, ECF subfamily
MNASLNKEMFIQLVKENKGIVYKVCNAYCHDKDNRDDLAQEILYNLWKSFLSFRTDLKFSTWMYRIALNVAISFYRKGKKTKPHFQIYDDMALFEEDEKDIYAQDNLKLLRKFIDELKEIDKSIILLYLDDKSQKEIAEITGITESNVSTRINRIKYKLKSNFLTNQNNHHGTK